MYNRSKSCQIWYTRLFLKDIISGINDYMKDGEDMKKHLRSFHLFSDNCIQDRMQYLN